MDTNAPVISIIVRIHIIIITIMVLRIASILLWLAMDIDCRFGASDEEGCGMFPTDINNCTTYMYS